MSIFAIFLGGPITPSPRLLAQVAGARVIAADSGIMHCAALGLTAELWLGDFDSAEPEHLTFYHDVPRKTFDRDKAMSDGELAICEAIERGASGLILVGAFGGARFDHAMVHIMAGISICETGLDVMLTDGVQEGHPLRLAHENCFDYSSGTCFSILGLTDLIGLNLYGAKWPLLEQDVAFGSSLTLSNVASGDLKITLSKGRAILIAHPDQQF